MKKFLSALLSVFLFLSLLSAFTGCFRVKPKTPSEKFSDALDALGEELRVGPFDRSFGGEGLNRAEYDIRLSGPKFLGEDGIVIHAESGYDAESAELSAGIKVSYKESAAEAAVDVFDGRETYVSFPGISDEFLHFSPEEALRRCGVAGDGAEALARLAELREKIGDIREKYAVDDRITVETADAEILGKPVRDVEKLSVSLDKDDVAGLAGDISSLAKLFNEEDGDGDGGAKVPDSVTVSLCVKDGRTVSAQMSSVTGGDSRAVIYELETDGSAVNAALSVVSAENGKTVKFVPVRYGHTREGDDYVGSVSFTPAGEPVKDDVVVSNPVSVDFSGKASGSSADFTYTFKRTVGGLAVEIPVKVKVEKDGGGNVRKDVTLEIASLGAEIGYTKIASNAAFEKRTVDPSRVIEMKEDMSAEDREKVDGIKKKLRENASDFAELFRALYAGSGGVFGSDPDGSGWLTDMLRPFAQFFTDEADGPSGPSSVSLNLISDYRTVTMNKDGWGTESFTLDGVSVNEGRCTFTLRGKSVGITLPQDGKAVSDTGEEYDVTYYPSGLYYLTGNSTRLWLYPDGAHDSSAEEMFSYEFGEDGTVSFTYGNGDVLTRTYEREGSRVTLDGEKYSVTEPLRFDEPELRISGNVNGNTVSYSFFADMKGERSEYLDSEKKDGAFVFTSEGETVILKEGGGTLTVGGEEYDVHLNKSDDFRMVYAVSVSCMNDAAAEIYTVFDDGGFCVVRKTDYFAYVRDGDGYEMTFGDGSKISVLPGAADGEWTAEGVTFRIPD